MYAQSGAAREQCVDGAVLESRRAWKKLLPARLAPCIGIAAGLFLAGCSTSGPGRGGAIESTSGGTGGAVVARVEIPTPQRNQFILRATLPVPRGTFPRPDHLTPFSVVDSDGTYAPTQVEAVTFYPSLSDGADVVEVSWTRGSST
jgi:hypothetical protein